LVFSLVFLVFGFLAAAEVIQTQESDSWDGIELDLTSLKVRDNILTLRFKFRNTGDQGQIVQFHYKDCYIVDEKNQKKYFLLKDTDGQFIGGPKDKEWEGGRFRFDIGPGKTKGMWMKFPEPTDNPESISIFIPGVFPFEEIPLK
jgi:hypothetical protein